MKFIEDLEDKTLLRTKVLESDKYVTIDQENNKIDPSQYEEFRITLKPLHDYNKLLNLTDIKIEDDVKSGQDGSQEENSWWLHEFNPIYNKKTWHMHILYRI